MLQVIANLTDAIDAPEWNAAFDQVWSGSLPARTTVVRPLLRPDRNTSPGTDDVTKHAQH